MLRRMTHLLGAGDGGQNRSAYIPAKLCMLGCISLILAAAPAFSGAALAQNQPGQQAVKDLLRYDLTITLDPPRGRMDVAGTIHVPASRITDRVLTLETSYFIEDFAPRIAPGQGDISIAEIGTRDGQWDKLWDLRLGGAPIPPGGLTLEIKYSVINQIKPQFAIRPEGSFAGSSGDAWYPQLDYAVPDTGILRFRTIPGDFVMGPGRRISSPGEETAGKFAFAVKNPAKFSFAAGPYHVQSAPGGAFTLATLTEIPDVEIWFGKIAAARAAMTEFYGPPPYETTALVEVNFPTIVLGTSEQGFILADESQFETFDFIYWAHELAHQWWGGLVRAERNSPAATSFTEGLAEFTALMSLEEVDGAAAAKMYRKRGWSYDDRGLVPRYFEQVEKGADVALRNLVPENQSEVLAAHRLSTSKVAFVLWMLADMVGRDAIQEALRTLAKNRRFGFASWADVERAIAQASGQDLEWFFEQWLGRPGAANLEIRWSGEDGKVTGRIIQSGSSYRLPLELELYNPASDERLKKTLWIEGEETAFVFEAPFDVRRIVLDPHFKILRNVRASDLLYGPAAEPGQ